MMVTAPHIPDYFLLQFTLAGSCTLAQEAELTICGRVPSPCINPCRPFTKKLVARWPPAPATDRSELAGARNACLDRARDPREPIEFDQSQAFAMEKVATLTHAVSMLCDDLRGESSGLDHPLVRDRVASDARVSLACPGCRTITARGL